MHAYKGGKSIGHVGVVVPIFFIDGRRPHDGSFKLLVRSSAILWLFFFFFVYTIIYLNCSLLFYGSFFSTF